MLRIYDVRDYFLLFILSLHFDATLNFVVAQLVVYINQLNDHDFIQLFFTIPSLIVQLIPGGTAERVLAQLKQALRKFLEIVELGLHGLVFLLVLRQVKDEVEVARARLEHLVTSTELEGATIALEEVV